MTADEGINETIKVIYAIFQATVPILSFILLSLIVGIDLIYPEKIELYWELVALIVIIVLLPFVPYISSVRVLDTEMDFDDSEWLRDKAETGSGATATEEGAKIQTQDMNYD